MIPTPSRVPHLALAGSEECDVRRVLRLLKAVLLIALLLLLLLA